MSLAIMYLKNLAVRAAKGEAHPGELARLPKFIDKYFGDGDGTFEVSDLVDAVTAVGSDVIDKAETVISFIADLF